MTKPEANSIEADLSLDMVPRNYQYQELFYVLLDALDDSTGSGAKYKNYENDVFKYNPYCWCDGDDCPLCCGTEYNFTYKPTGISIYWYKYPMRGAFCYPSLPTPGEFRGIIFHCIEPVRG